LRGPGEGLSCCQKVVKGEDRVDSPGVSKVLALLEAMKGPPFSSLGLGVELSSEPPVKKAPSQNPFQQLGVDNREVDGHAATIPLKAIEEGGRVIQIKKALLSLLWAWKGKFKKFVGELDRIMASFWAGLVRFGPQFGLGWARKPVTIRKPCWAVSKRTCKPNPNITDGSDSDGSELKELSKLSDQVLRTPEASAEDLSKVFLMVGVVPVNLEGNFNGSGPLRFDGVDGATSSSVFIQTTPESQVSVFPFTVTARLSDRGIHILVSTFQRGFLKS
jgi:hypothetical protein